MKTRSARSTLWLSGALLLALCFAPMSACTPEVRDFGSGGAGGSGGSTSSGGQCTGDSECGASDECQSFVCEQGFCKVNFAPDGTPIATQAIGDCQSSVCDGAGYVKDVLDPTDPEDDGNPCTLEACMGTTTQHGNLAAETPCEGAFLCDGFGTCVECLTNDNCTSGICAANICAPATCDDNVKNGGESDVDCGGPDCAKCDPDRTCNVALDCKSEVCAMSICMPPTCSDGVKNGTETDKDCGGSDCPKCGTGASCKAGIDCTSGVCTESLCKAPTCNDGVKNGTETDVDCGGKCLFGCPVGKVCLIDSDCLSNNCCTPLGGKAGYCEKAGLPCPLAAN